MTSLKDIIIDNVKSVIIIKEDSKHHSDEKISQISDACFVWSQDIKELTNIAGLIDGLLVDDEPGHQYLTSEEDILIVLGYRELS